MAKSQDWTDLMSDALVLAKKLDFDVFNALDLMENTEFLERLKFGIGDGNLQYYLYNWRCPIVTSKEIGLVLQWIQHNEFLLLCTIKNLGSINYQLFSKAYYSIVWRIEYPKPVFRVLEVPYRNGLKSSWTWFFFIFCQIWWFFKVERAKKVNWQKWKKREGGSCSTCHKPIFRVIPSMYPKIRFRILHPSLFCIQ